MIKKIHQQCPVITQEGLTFKLSQNQYLIWKPQRDTAFERISGTLSHVGVTKKIYKHWADKRTPHQKDSQKYYLVMSFEKSLWNYEQTDAFESKNPGSWPNTDKAYIFESKEHGNVIEQVMYNFTEGDPLGILFKDGKFSIDTGDREKVCELPYWNIRNNDNKVCLYHDHPLTERTFEVPFIKKGKKYVCQGCSRKPPKGVVMQMSLATGIVNE